MTSLQNCVADPSPSSRIAVSSCNPAIVPLSLLCIVPCTHIDGPRAVYALSRIHFYILCTQKSRVHTSSCKDYNDPL